MAKGPLRVRKGPFYFTCTYLHVRKGVRFSF